MYNTNSIDEFEPELEFCESDKQKDIWLGLRLKMSSFEYSGKSVGRMIKILIRDKKTQKYVGVASLGSDVDCKLFDEYIGWNNELKYDKKMFNHLMNITTCVGIPPFSFNYNAGKLIAMLMFSKEIYKYVYEKYKDELVCITTFSLYGKSIQYDRLNELKYVGLTKGESVSEIPKWLSDCVNIFLNENTDKKLSRRLHKMKFLITNFGFPDTILKGKPKGAYIGFTGDLEHCKKFLQCKIKRFKPNNIKSVDEIYNFWKDRWANQRYTNLLSTQKIMLSCDYTNSVVDKKDYDRIKKIKSKDNTQNDKKLSNEEKIKILDFFNKNKSTSMVKMEEIFTNEFNKKVDRRTISKLIYC